jgi:hypothetical protein
MSHDTSLQRQVDYAAAHAPAVERVEAAVKSDTRETVGAVKGLAGRVMN